MLKTALLAAAIGMIPLAGLNAQEFPTQTVEILVPYEPGGGSDILARPLAAELSKILMGDVIVVNKGGAAGNIGAQVVARANPDGHMLLMANNSHVVNPYLYDNAGYNTEEDFVAVSMVATAPMVLVVHEDVPAQNVQELIAYAKENPAELNFANPGTGTPGHLAAARFNRLSGIDLQQISYKGSGPTTLGLLQNEVQLSFTTPAAVKEHFGAGLRPLAVTSAERFPALPDVPTLAESGVPELADFDMSIWWGLLAPSGTDKAVLDELSAAVVEAVHNTDIKDKWTSVGMVPQGTTHEAFQEVIDQDLKTWGAFIPESGITVD